MSGGGKEGPASQDKGPLLGRQVSGSEHYDPTLLFPVPRATARASLPGGRFRGCGEDIWHAYELNWLLPGGEPVMRLGVLSLSAETPYLVESKSLKLYLQSLNQHPFPNDDAARRTIEADLGAVAGGPVSLELHDVGSVAFAGARAPGDSLDALAVAAPGEPREELLLPSGETRLHCHTHRLRSLCPVTGQPDWATVVIDCHGAAPTREGLLAYLLAFRAHREFHEQCVERIFSALMERVAPDFLSVHALYTRRGGLDISPWRCSEPRPAPRYRLDRQ